MIYMCRTYGTLVRKSVSNAGLKPRRYNMRRAYGTWSGLQMTAEKRMTQSR